MKRIAIGLILIFLTGCVSEKAMLTNSKGQVVHCDNMGWGWIGAPVAMAQHSDCMKKAHAAGYYESGAVPESAKQ